MAFSKSKNALERVKPILEILLAAEDDVELKFDNPHKWIYWLRDGMEFAKNSPSSEFSELKAKYILRLKPGMIFAELRIKKIEVNAAVIASKLNILRIPNVTEIMEVVGAAIKHKAPKFEFPDAKITGNGIVNLKMWCDKNSYAITQTEPFLIIEKIDAGVNNQENGGVELGGR